MLSINWINILLIISGCISSILLFNVAYKAKSLSNLFFGLSILFLLVGIITGMIVTDYTDVANEWGELLAMTSLLCGLFVKTRNSKPIFARFPLPMTLLPILGVLFYPMINQADVIKELLWITYQGGALIVALLVISINHFLYKHRTLLLLACFILAISFALYWFISISDTLFTQNIALALFALGMLVGSIGFKKVAITKIENQS
jgi:hypothetical protein